MRCVPITKEDQERDPIISSLCLIIISWLGAEPVASISGTFLIFIKGGVSERRFKLKKPLDIQMVLLSAITTLLSCSYGRCLAQTISQKRNLAGFLQQILR